MVGHAAESGPAPIPPPPPPEGWRDALARFPKWAYGLAAVLVAVVVAAVVATSGSSAEPGETFAGSSTTAAGSDAESLAGSGTTSEGSTTTPEEPGTQGTGPAGATIPAEEGSGTTEPSGEGESGGESAPFAWPSDISVRFETEPGVVDAYFTWTNPEGETQFTYLYSFEGDGGDGGDFGELLAEYVHYENAASCNGQVTFELVAWSGDTELGRQDVSATTPDCPAEPPTGMNARWTGNGVEISWTPGAGYSHYLYEVTTSDAGTSGIGSGTDAATLSTAAYRFFIPLGCGIDFSFDLTPVMDDGGMLDSVRYGGRSPSCPTFFIAEGPVVTVPAGTGRGSTASCGVAEPISGGFRVWPDASAMPYPGWMVRNGPDGSGWGAYAVAPPERSLQVQGYALCSMGGALESTTSHTQLEVPSGRVRSLVATCPPGTVVTGGGFNTAAGSNVLNSSRDGNGWRVTAFNELSGPATLDTYAVCVVDGTGQAVASDNATTVSVADGQYGPGSNLACPAGTTLTGGGFASPDAFFVSSYPRGTGNRKLWLVDGFNRAFESGPAGPAVVIEASAVCVAFPLGWSLP